ncbi:MAG: hypothetical protein C7M88_07570 [Candidatus Arcticimaribacter sp.]|nr:MAG: hypothetical protein C7M88_07570 [Candidatus Arcticimaribacter sp.]
MKKILYFTAIMLFVACGNDDDSVIDVVAAEGAITALAATGTVAQQTPAEAKKTIYGKWDLSNSSKSIAASKSNACAFDYIEFNDEDYIMSLVIEDETITAFGAYVLNEDAAGNVSSVELKFNLGASDITIATLTNIVVVESDDDLSATFDVVLSIPEEADFDACNTLQGEYTAEKEEPMAESVGAAGNSIHAKLIETWMLASATMEGQDVMSETLGEPCYYEDANGEEALIEGCSNANSISLSFSAFGTYSIVWVGSNQGTFVEAESWGWVGSDYTSFYIGNQEDEEIVDIISLTDTQLTLSNYGVIYTLVAQ